MPKQKFMINNVTRGQMGKNMKGRDDLDIQKASFQKAQNIDFDLQGSFRNRPGSLFLGQTKDNKKAWLKEFIFNEEQNYAMEFTDLCIRFWAKGVSGKWGLVVEDDGTTIHEVTTPYTEADIPFLSLAQNADVIFIAHRLHKPMKLTRTAANNFTLTPHVITPTTGDYDWNTQANRPDAVMFYEQRLLYAASDNKPQTVWGSKTGNQNDFNLANADDGDGFAYTIGSNKRNRIRWITDASDKAVLGTQGGHFDLTGSSIGTAITPKSVKIRRSTSKGVSEIPPINVNNVILYALAGDEKIDSYEYSINADSSVSVDRSIFNEEITRSGVGEITFYKGRTDYIVMPTNDGRAVKLVWKPEQSIFAWDDMTTDGKFISFCSLPQQIGSDRLLSVIERVVNDTTKYYVEIMAPDFDIPDFNDYFTGATEKEDKERFKCDLWEAQREYIYMDSAVTYNGSERPIAADATLTIDYTYSQEQARVTSDNALFSDGSAPDTPNDVGKKIILKDCDEIYYIDTFVSTTEVIVTPQFNPTASNKVVSKDNYYITTNIVDGLDHLEGKSVTICKDGAVIPNKTVSGGQITLGEVGIDNQGAVIHVGLPYRCIAKTQNLQLAGYSGTVQADRKNIKGCNFKVLDTISFKAGTSYYNAKTVLFTKVYSNKTKNNTDRPPEPQTGYSTVDLPNTTNQEMTVVIVKDDPTPMVIQQIIPNIDITT